jgi:glucose-6-phosphate dehydrogenase assembly protein OpcA
MVTTYKVLGQVSPSATTETTLYTVPSATSAIGSSIIIANRGTSVATFRVSIAVSGVSTTNKDYLYYDLPIGANDTFIATIGITLATTDEVRVYASNTNLSFSLYGSEIS